MKVTFCLNISSNSLILYKNMKLACTQENFKKKIKISFFSFPAKFSSLTSFLQKKKNFFPSPIIFLHS